MPDAAAVRARAEIARLFNGQHTLNMADVITREYAPLVKAARDISLCGTLDIDARLDYIEVQISRKEWAALHAALQEVVGK